MCRCREVRGSDATTCTVTEHESSTWLVDGAHIGAREALGGLDLDGQEQTAFVNSERPGQDRRA